MEAYEIAPDPTVVSDYLTKCVRISKVWLEAEAAGHKFRAALQ